MFRIKLTFLFDYVIVYFLWLQILTQNFFFISHQPVTSTTVQK